jgi:nucleotide-binding universal stress UspA family protein
MNIKKIVVPVDFSECSRAALQFALRFARPFGASVEAIHVVSPPPYLPLDMALWGSMQEAYNTRIEREMQRLIEEVTAGSDLTVTMRLDTGVPYDVIISASEQADLIVMGTHGRTGLPHLLLGSVAERTLRGSKCPVLTVPLVQGQT